MRGSEWSQGLIPDVLGTSPSSVGGRALATPGATATTWDDTWQEMELWHVTRDKGWPEAELFMSHEPGVNSDNGDKWSMEYSCSQLTTISRLWAKTSSAISQPIRGQHWGHVICLGQWEASIERKQSLNHQYIQEWSLFGRFNTFLRLGLFCCCSKFIKQYQTIILPIKCSKIDSTVFSFS